jgi:alkanesulfonate monooxygenase SsuD/methylene tetrahydromethanopterin reductase-like flavin-dependent oxidoreductase (luciferase family)
MRRVARYGDGWHPFLLSAEQMADRLRRLDEELEKAERTREDITISLRVPIDEVPSQEAADAFAELGVDELVLSLDSGDVTEQRRRLESAARALL